MAVSATRRIAEVPGPATIAAALLAVAASGGRDSTALLHCAARAAKGTALKVVALHVHHGLHPDADRWAAHLSRQVGRWARAGLPVSLVVQRLTVAPGRGDSVEAWARRERYAALAAMSRAAGSDTVLLAQHRRDQAETVLLQMLRGGGPAALAAMPASAQRNGLHWLRPWLDMPREAIEAYVRRHRLSYVDDGSNAEVRFARNRLRAQVWPTLYAAFPDAEVTLAAAARRSAEAAAVLDEVAAQDLSAAIDETGALLLEVWRALSPARRAVALRVWLARHVDAGPPEALVQRLLAEAPRARSARWPASPGELCSQDGRLRYVHPHMLVGGPPATRAGGDPRLALPLAIDLSRPGIHPVPVWAGRFVVERAPAGQGVAPEQLRHAELRARGGGEQFQRTPRGTARSLKKQFQALRVAAWERGGPLVWAAGRLIYVPTLGLDARCLAADVGKALTLRWEPAGAPPPPR